jgi:hypothetical protein
MIISQGQYTICIHNLSTDRLVNYKSMNCKMIELHCFSSPRFPGPMGPGVSRAFLRLPKKMSPWKPSELPGMPAFANRARNEGCSTAQHVQQAT